MNYIYDVVLNLNPKYYEFYEWQKQDNIVNIRKIPVFKVDNQTYLSLKYNKVTVDSGFITKISSHSSIYSDNSQKQELKNICLVTNGKEVLGLSFNNNGKLLKRSSLIFDEEQDVLEDTTRCPTTTIIFIENKKVKPSLTSRIEQDKRNYLTKYLKSLNENHASLLKYLYYEYYEQEETNPQIIQDKLLKELSQDWNPHLDNLYQLALLLNKNEQKSI